MRIVYRLLILIIPLALILALACYSLFLSPSALKAHVHHILTQYLSADITLGAASLHPLRGLTLSGLSVKRSPGGEALFKAGLIKVRPRWRSLLGLKMEIAELTMDTAELTIAKDPAGKSNWSRVLHGGIPVGGRPPLFRLTRGKLRIGGYTLQGLDCEITPFTSQRLLAIRGTVRDPAWGNYLLSGNIDSDTETIRLTIEGRDLNITEQWVRNFPKIGTRTWNRYHSCGLFDLTGNITYCWRDLGKSDYSLLFTAQEASLTYLLFPVTKATGRLFIDPYSVVINHLEGELCTGHVEGYSIINLDLPSTYFNRYTLEDVDMSDVLHLFKIDTSVSGKGSGYVTFQGDHILETYQGKGELTVPDARLWNFPLILMILSKLQYPLWTGEEPIQNCTINFSFSEQGLVLDKISLVSDVLDIYGEGTGKYDGTIAFTFYVRPVSKMPLLLADLLLQPALDNLVGNLVQFQVTGTAAHPSLTLIPLTPLSKNIVNFFDSITRQRIGR